MQGLVPQLIERCAEMLGGFDRVAKWLNVGEHTVRFWLTGRATAPQEAILKLTDLVLKDDIARARQDRRRQPRSGVEVEATRESDTQGDHDS